MMSDKDINSAEYWDTRFIENWENCEGPQQSRFFAKLSIENLPSWLIEQIRRAKLTFADWGCAQGDGTDVWASYIDARQIVGVDFSSVAIEQAAKRYPALRFVSEDWLTTDARQEKTFDIVFSSNTFEHFYKPYEVLFAVSTRASKAIVVALPYMEFDRIDEHFFTFLPDNIPLVLRNGFRLVWSRVVDCRILPDTRWPGNQVLLVYANPEWLDKLGLVLRDSCIQHVDIGSELNRLNQAVAERDAALTERDAALTERDAALTERDAALTERDAALTERDAALTERDAALTERDAALTERDAALEQCVSISIDRDRATLDRDAVIAQRDAINEQITILENQAHHLQNQNELLSQKIYSLLASKSWLWTKPFRKAYDIISWINWRIHDVKDAYIKGGILNIIKKVHDYISNTPNLIESDATKEESFFPNFFLAPRPSEFPDYIIWGVIDWHFRHQRPQHLAQSLAASGRRVFYVSSKFIKHKRPGFDLEPIDINGRLFHVYLYADNAPAIYTSIPSIDVIAQLKCGIGQFLLWTNSCELISIVQHPFWYDTAIFLPNSRVVYDCMDYHEGFDNTAPEIVALERSLLHDADLTITTSAWLDEIVSNQAKRRALVRNACEFEHFARLPASIYRDRQGRRIIGYYGAIAEWFDQDLVEAVAKRFSDCCVLLIGADTVNANNRLGQLPNVKLVGEVPYLELPRYLQGFDVCMLPFKVIPLTLATNPVKIYEYLSAGKPVVSVNLPEMKQFGDLIKVADNPEAFLQIVADILSCSTDPVDINKRQAFAKEQTWKHRVEALISYVEHAMDEPTISVIVVTYNNLELTKKCLTSLNEHSAYSNLEIIVIDNASSDGSREFLTNWAQTSSNRKLVLNDNNKGFAAANNQGLAITSGEYLALLNNDTYVTPGWARTLANRLRRDKSIGLIGPVTNNIGNEAKININYTTMDEMLNASNNYTRQHIGKMMQLRTLAFFCVMMRRDVYERVGSLDEAFGIGFFEDDDYCRRVEQLGLRIVCVEDVFIHHHLSASFNKLNNQERQALFEKNKEIYEAKWGKWIPHGYRDSRITN